MTTVIQIGRRERNGLIYYSILEQDTMKVIANGASNHSQADAWLEARNLQRDVERKLKVSV